MKAIRTGELAESNCFHFSWRTFESDLLSRFFWRSTAKSWTDLGIEFSWKNSSVRNRLTGSLKRLIPSRERTWSPPFITLLSVADRVYILFWMKKYLAPNFVRYSSMHTQNFFSHVPNQLICVWTSWSYAVKARLRCETHLLHTKMHRQTVLITLIHRGNLKL